MRFLRALGIAFALFFGLVGVAVLGIVIVLFGWPEGSEARLARDHARMAPWDAPDALPKSLMSLDPSKYVQTASYTCPQGGLQPPIGPGKRLLGSALLFLTFNPLGAAKHLVDLDPLVGGARGKLKVTVVDAATGEEVKAAVVAAIYPEKDRFFDQAPSGSTFDLRSGRYILRAAAPGPSIRWGEAEVVVESGTDQSFRLELDRVLPPVTPRTPKPLPAGGSGSLAWDGAAPSGFITTVFQPPGSSQERRDYEPNPARAVDVSVPPKTGSYAATYVLCAPYVRVARWRFDVGPSDIQLTAPETARGGEQFTVGWKGSGSGRDSILLYEAKENGRRAGIMNVAGPGTVSFQAPLAGGEYRIVYEAQMGSVPLAERRIRVDPASVEMVVPERIPFRSEAEIAWRTEADADLDLQILPFNPDGTPGSKSIYNLTEPSTRIWTLPLGKSTVQVVQRDASQLPVASRVIEVTGEILGNPPKTAKAGEPVTVTAAVEPAPGDGAAITSPNALFVFSSDVTLFQPGSREVQLTAPGYPGDYEIVYVAGRGTTVGGDTEMMVQRSPLKVE